MAVSGLPRLARLVEGWIWRSADSVVAVTEVLADRIAGAGVPRSAIAVMPNGIDLDRFRAAPAAEVAKRDLGLVGHTVLGFIGFVRPWHGLEQIIDWLASAAIPDLVLAVAGNGPAIPELTERAQARGVADRVRFLGVVERAEVPAVLAAFDIALQPAVVDYASPLKLFEYMASGKAILAPSSPNIREILTDGQDALLGTADDLTDRLQRLVDDPELRGSLGRSALETLLGRDLTWDRNAARVEAIGDSLRRRSGARPRRPICRAPS